MSIPVFLSYSKEQVAIHYECPSNPDYEVIDYKSGANIIDFIYLDVDSVLADYNEMIPMLIAECLAKTYYDVWTDAYYLFRKLDEKYPCVFFYNHFFLSRFSDVFYGDEIKLEEFELIDFGYEMPDAPIGSEKIEKNYLLFFEYTIKMIIKDIVRKKEFVLQEADRIYRHSQDKGFSKLSPEQKLYYLDVMPDSNRFVYSNAEYRRAESHYQTALIPVHFMPCTVIVPDENFSDYLLSKNYNLIEAHQISTIMEWMKLEFYKIIMLGFGISKCHYCNDYFILYGRKDLKYCDRIKDGEEEPCSKIGAIRIYQQKTRENDVYADFQRAYKRMHARFHNKKMTIDEFSNWSEEAQRKRKECLDGVLSREEFNQWLGNKPRKGGVKNG